MSADTATLLLEIGSEEIPARFIPPAQNMLKEKTGQILREFNVGYSDIKAYATPRRLSVMVYGIPPMQKDCVREVYGPPKRAAFDPDGRPTKAATGFAGSQGIDVKDLVIRTKDKGEYIAAVIEQKGTGVRDVLPVALKKIILSLTFPKSMRWGNGSLRFVRPLHWIAAVLGTETLHLDIDGITSGNRTRGHRFLSPKEIMIEDVALYMNLLEDSYVVLDHEKRRKMIIDGIEELSAPAGGMVLMDDSLLDTVTNLVEYPAAVLCNFPPEYLKLPKELLITVMRDHQKYFAIGDKAGGLKNSFVVISNTRAENAGTVRAGAERVIKARFEDARFYYEEDVKKPLNKKVQELKRVTFHDRLGNLFEKTERVVNIASHIAGLLCPEKSGKIKRAAMLCKADLLSGVVGEFPELQGLMGKYYALYDGEDEEVAAAIMEQYLPAYSGDRLPESDEGSILSLADKIDNIVSFFSIGIIPTGSEDPFALRRQAIGVVAILTEKGYKLTLRDVIDKAAGDAKDKESLTSEVLQFMMPRVEALLSSKGYEDDSIRAVMHIIGDSPLTELWMRVEAVRRFSSEPGYNAFLLAIKRVNNIVSPQKAKGFQEGTKEDLFTEPYERQLYAEARKIKPLVRDMLKNGSYYEALMLLQELTPHINSFFDNVLVMDKREDVRMNRLALLREVWSNAFSIADFSKLSER